MSVLDEAAGELLATVVTIAGRRLMLAWASPRGRARADIEVARWFDTYSLSEVTLPALCGGVDPDDVAAFLGENAVQSILHGLLAARLTDAPEVEAARLSELFAVSARGLLTEEDSLALFDFFDARICELVGRVREAEPELLHRMRQDAFLSRVVAAIERQRTARGGLRDRAADSEFIGRYRRQVADYHGRLQPPDFERRRLIPIGDLYVSPVVSHLVDAEPGLPLPRTDIWRLDDGLDRAVLLGDPGGGKTTASHVIMHRHGSDPARRVPFMVTLREFAATDPPESSVVGHIEHKLETFYQCPPPPGLVESLLFSGSALVIFDGLDELLDTTRRSDVAAVVERFCAEYPLASVLVTSRVVGYDQARLDDRQFESYQLGGFDAGQVIDYVRKWFALQDSIEPGEAESFLAESAGVTDLRSNPLMLALMCILYRGERSIPLSRPEVYEKCATLLFHRWDASRKIHRELRARNMIEPALRYLAYWLLTRPDAQHAITSNDLVSRTASYFLSRGFEPSADAQAAATEFVEFCRGRLWVFTEAGTTGRGEPVYSFTHRTFFEYFAAAYLASIHDSPERLASSLASRLARSEWDTVAQLAVQIKDHASEKGADRIFRKLLSDRRHRSAKASGNILGFLGRCTEFAEPAPATVRVLTARALAHALTAINDDETVAPLAWLMVSARGDARTVVASELETRIAELVASSDSDERLLGLRLALQVYNAPFAVKRGDEAWHDWEVASRHKEQLLLAAQSADDIAVRMCFDRENVPAILARRTDLPDFLFVAPPTGFLDISWISLASLAVRYEVPGDSADTSILAYLGRVLNAATVPPRISRSLIDPFFWGNPDDPIKLAAMGQNFSEDLYRAIVYILCVFTEISGLKEHLTPADLGALASLHPYLAERMESKNRLLPALPVDARWQDIFRTWAAEKISFTFSDD